VYPTYLALHERAPSNMSAVQQREADAQLGLLAVAVSQLANRIRAAAHGAADVLAQAGHQSALFRKTGERARRQQLPVPCQDAVSPSKSLRN
jgi:hypothetical protein